MNEKGQEGGAFIPNGVGRGNHAPSRRRPLVGGPKDSGSALNPTTLNIGPIVPPGHKLELSLMLLCV